MHIEENQLYGVVTGDVVDSSKLSKGDRLRLHEAMTASSADAGEVFSEELLAEVEIFAGDSWQMVLQVPSQVLRAALFYRASLRARMRSRRSEVRMALAIGTIHFIPEDRVSQGDGEVFRSSGRTIEEMRRGPTMRFRFPHRPEEGALDVVVQLIDALAAGWSFKQALAVTGALRGWKQERIARSCWEEPISQQAVAQHLDRAAWGSVNVGLDFFERTIVAALNQEP